MPKFIIWVPFMRVAGMALFPFILIRDKKDRNNAILINHEEIHLMQQLEMGILLFYIFYLASYLFNLWKYKEHYIAYRNIYFEKEAYAHEYDLDYLKTRRWWNFLKYR